MSNYITISDADTYFATRLDTDVWDDASDDDKTAALTQATRAIDRLNYRGKKNSESQDNQFPRYDDSEVPVEVEYACCELALAFLDGVDQEHEFDNLRVQAQQMDIVKSTYTDEVPIHIVAGIPSIEAWRFLLPYIRDFNSPRLRRAN